MLTCPVPLLSLTHTNTEPDYIYTRLLTRNGRQCRPGVGQAAEDVRHQHRVEGVARGAVVVLGGWLGSRRIVV